MANISALISIIQQAARGEDVRDAIVDALEAMNSEIPDADKIGDMLASVYDPDDNIADAGGIEAYVSAAIGTVIGGQY